MRNDFSVESLIQRIKSGEELSYIFFWGHRPTKEVSKSCFSQWYESPFEVNGELYKTAEHWMMAMKADLFNDSEIKKKIIESATPKDAKNLGRKVKNFDAEIWDENKLEVVIAGNYHKFSQNDDLFYFLLSTYTQILVEASPVDRVWGIGMAQSHANVKDPSSWNGDNLLGVALMNVRNIFLKYEKPNSEIEIMLPPWKKYPEMSRYSIGWRMGYGEDYFGNFVEYMNKLSEAEKIELKMVYPALGEWKNWYDE